MTFPPSTGARGRPPRPQVEGYRRVALGYVARGWPVLPGSSWTGNRFEDPSVPGRLTDGLQPIRARGQATTDPATVARWWNAGMHWPPAILLSTGSAFDVVKLSRFLYRRMLASAPPRSALGTVLWSPDALYAFVFVQPAPRSAATSGVQPGPARLLPRGSCVAAPPTRVARGVVRWHVPPDAVSGRLPPLSDVLAALPAARQGTAVA